MSNPKKLSKDAKLLDRFLKKHTSNATVKIGDKVIIVREKKNVITTDIINLVTTFSKLEGYLYYITANKNIPELKIVSSETLENNK